MFLFQNPFLVEWSRDEERMHQEFERLLQDMEQYLQPIMSQLEATMRYHFIKKYVR